MPENIDKFLRGTPGTILFVVVIVFSLVMVYLDKIGFKELIMAVCTVVVPLIRKSKKDDSKTNS